MFGPQQRPTLSPQAAAAAERALAKIFWGTLLAVLDFWLSYTTNGSGIRFDVLNDAVGMLLIAWGVYQLSAIWDEPAYRRTMSLCFCVSLLALGQAVLDHLVLPWPPLFGVVSTLFSLVCLVCIYLFCAAMRTFCWLGQLDQAEASWRTSQLLFLILSLVPSAIMHAAGWLYFAAAGRASLEIGPLAILLLIAAVVPLIHMFVSISRTRRALLAAP